jgi:hypothetical protein
MQLGVRDKSRREEFPFLRRKSKMGEELGFASALWVIKSQEVPGNFAFLDMGRHHIRKIH